jgi:uncharacterized membrane protein YdjX (TVP38/TMEM64 family)
MSRGRIRLGLALAALLLGVVLPYAWWGEVALPLAGTQGRPGPLWLWGLGLLAADLVLPIPATGVMASLGHGYGPWLGGALSAVGSFLAGALGYALAQPGRRRFVRWLADPDEVERFRGAFARWGVWVVAAGRGLPVLPEVTAVLAGLLGLSPRRYLPALAVGAGVNGFLYAGLGAALPPAWALPLSLLIPVALLAALLSILGRSDPANRSPPMRKDLFGTPPDRA